MSSFKIRFYVQVSVMDNRRGSPSNTLVRQKLGQYHAELPSKIFATVFAVESPTPKDNDFLMQFASQNGEEWVTGHHNPLRPQEIHFSKGLQMSEEPSNVSLHNLDPFFHNHLGMLKHLQWRQLLFLSTKSFAVSADTKFLNAPAAYILDYRII